MLNPLCNMPGRSKTSLNETRKITAAALNNTAVSFIVSGLVLPMVIDAYQLSYSRTVLSWVVAVLWLDWGERVAPGSRCL